jgi:hypothetical protein
VPLKVERERLELPDGDFLDLDWHFNRSKNLIIATHGLEGDSTRHYVTGIIKKFAEKGFDGLAWNARSCSGEINRLPRFYHHGDASDLKFVTEYAINKGYENIFLVGFSMGGSLTLRLLGEYGDSVPKPIKGAAVASVPLDLTSSVVELDKPGKRFYQKRFLKKLGKKIKIKAEMFTNDPLIDHAGYEKIKNFEQFDSRYTAPLHGYANAADFYKQASSKPLLPQIKVRSLIVQAINDPFLTPECLEIASVTHNPLVRLLLTKEGGHVGFMKTGSKHTFFEDTAWSWWEGR